MKPIVDYSLYLVTDSELLGVGSIGEMVKEAIAGGVTLVQLREKKMDTGAFIELARSIKAICKEAGVPLLINDRIDVALAIDADGVHIGQDDMPLTAVRKLLGPDKIIGVTAETPAQALEAARNSADYLGTAAIFPTVTKIHKPGFQCLGIPGVKAIMEQVKELNIPIVTIGGIKIDNVGEVMRGCIVTRADGTQVKLNGVAVVSAITLQQDPKAAAAALLAQVKPNAAGIYSQPSTSETDKFILKIGEAFKNLREKKPLVHNITNFVAMEISANAVLAIGGLPVMAHCLEEAADITKISNALVINIGTLSPQWIESMHAAAKQANEMSIPIVLDPVGAGATPFRTKTCLDLITTHRLSIIKGNAGEIAAITGDIPGLQVRGVESVGTLANPGLVAKILSKRSGAVIAISGAVDTISDGTRVVQVRNGSHWMGTFTGSGCSATAVTACFAAVEPDRVVAAVSALVAYGIAGELADTKGVAGPQSFRMSFLDAIYNLTVDKVLRNAKIELIE
ncbi:hypothetical protein SmJEL517_g04578 [Synchytrium microbalum]|uniref:Thiamine phosphate synthase/TenI domain-containing protein n=1 Tax=Synchytrium microbalum TaxID=1806994 RepID=A0A507BZI5_9FUNG|nr:uncharacterized protein SmJEL517_g04578 [Synchytrium microbalum]TPX32279.1 hypothetical protein SmJEL517_g04578 [Synchytrium microbalum]